MPYKTEKSDFLIIKNLLIKMYSIDMMDNNLW